MTMTEIKAMIKKLLRTGTAAASPLFSSKSSMTEDQARELLASLAPKPRGSGCGSHTMPECRCDLQIVVPAYNVEEYLRSCMDSILNQKTKYTYHVVLVDDGAKDRTPEICDEYAADPRVTVIHQKNRGLSGARNTGMAELFGRYVMFVDSDDLLCEGAIDGLMDTAMGNDCDLVEGGAYYLYENGSAVMHRYDREQQIENPYAQFHGHAWGKLYKRELLRNLIFPEGYWYEDSLLSFLVFPMAKKCFRSPQMAYSYRINQSGIVKSSVGKPRAVETYWITEQMLSERKALELPMDIKFFSFMLLQIRLNQLRVENLSREAQEAVFVLTCQLMDEYFPESMRESLEKHLLRALETRDFGMFRMCCKFF